MSIPVASMYLLLHHCCRYLGCMVTCCILCENNPNKTCMQGDHVEVLRANCEADISVELYNLVTGQAVSMAGVAMVVRQCY